VSVQPGSERVLRRVQDGRVTEGTLIALGIAVLIGGRASRTGERS
jgi:hypothetical protein